jgi:hypothetical protein
MFKIETSGRTRLLIVRGPSAAALALCLLFALLQVRSADASDRRRNVAIGAGIVGAIIANELRRSEMSERRTVRRRAARSRSKVASQSRGRKYRHAAKSKPKPPRQGLEAPRPEAAVPVVAPDAATAGTVISTPSEITSAQQHLQYIGYDITAATGVLDLKTKIAIMQFQESLGAPTTGVLTVEQLQALFLQAAERHAGGK